MVFFGKPEGAEIPGFGKMILLQLQGFGLSDLEGSGFSVKRGGRHSVNDVLGEAMQRRGLGHSVNRWTLKTEKLLSSPPFRKVRRAKWG